MKFSEMVGKPVPLDASPVGESLRSTLGGWLGMGGRNVYNAR